MKWSLRNKIQARKETGNFTQSELDLVEAKLVDDIEDLIQQELRNFIFGLETTATEFKEGTTSEDEEDPVEQYRFYWGADGKIIFYDDIMQPIKAHEF